MSIARSLQQKNVMNNVWLKCSESNNMFSRKHDKHRFVLQNKLILKYSKLSLLDGYIIHTVGTRTSGLSSHAYIWPVKDIYGVTNTI